MERTALAGVHAALMTGGSNRVDAFRSWAVDFFGKERAPEALDRSGTPRMVWDDDEVPEAAAAAAGQDKADWTCPAVFGTQTVAALNAALARATQPYKLNWSKLNSIVDGAVEPLTKLFTQWAGQNVQLR